jgi:hypothetical protein
LIPTDRLHCMSIRKPHAVTARFDVGRSAAVAPACRPHSRQRHGGHDEEQARRPGVLLLDATSTGATENNAGWDRLRRGVRCWRGSSAVRRGRVAMISALSDDRGVFGASSFARSAARRRWWPSSI